MWHRYAVSAIPALPRPAHPLARAALVPAIACATGLLGLLPGPAFPALPVIAARIGVDPAAALGLSLALLGGLLAWHAAAVSADRAPPARIALLPALLVPALVPGLGVAALAPALIASAIGGGTTRIVAILVQCSASLNLLGSAEIAPQVALQCSALAIIVLACGFSRTVNVPKAANDNPDLARSIRNRWLPSAYPHVTFAAANPGNWGVSDVQQQSRT